jgi:hypothetical protein
MQTLTHPTLDALTPAQLLRETAAAELRAATGGSDADLALRAELERRAEGLAITQSQLEGWACITCGISAGIDEPMVPVRSIVCGPGATWTLFAHPACVPATAAAVSYRGGPALTPAEETEYRFTQHDE